jgi:RimJ/RimL family protein N-acetyltransferase
MAGFQHITSAARYNPRMTRIQLRPLLDADLPALFDQQLDPEANRMAAFTAKDPADRDAFVSHWAKIMADETTIIRAILFEGRLAGSVLVHRSFGEPEVSYWLGREFWGQGIATAGLAAFLQVVTERPLFARAAFDNLGS